MTMIKRNIVLILCYGILIIEAQDLTTVVDYSDYDVLVSPTSPSPSDPSDGGGGDIFPLTFPPEPLPPPTTLPPPPDTIVEPPSKETNSGGDELLNGKRLTSTFVPLPPVSSTSKSIGSINNTKNSENDLYEAEEDYSGVNQVYDVNNNNPLFDAEYDERLDENQEFIAAEVNPDRERTLNKLLHQEQLSVPQRDEEIVLTDEGGSSLPQEIGKPENLTASKINSNSTVLTWTMRTSYNLIKGYRVYYEHKFTDIKTFHGQKPEYKLTGLQPHTTYRISVAPVGKEWDTEGEHSDIISVTTDTDKPSAPFITNATCYESVKIYLEWKRPKIYYRSVDYYFIYYKEKDAASYQVHKIQGSTLDDDQKFFLEESSSKLIGNHMYRLKIAAGTKSTKTDSVYEGESSKEVEVYLPSTGCQYGESSSAMTSDLSIGVLVGAVTALCLLLVSLISFLVWKKHMDSSYSFLEDPPPPVQRVGIPDWEGELGPDGYPGAVNVLDFPAHVARLHADSDIGFSREYNEILRYSSDGVNATSEHSQHPDNKHKNRYLNIVAYDHSRVQLSVLPGQKRTSDYINASYIDGFQKFQAYIGSQGPLDDTFEAFWRMMWEQNVHVIVMITNLLERGRKKCDMYWPKEGATSYGQIDVTLVSEQVRANYTVRVMRMKHNKVKKKKWICNERTVTQFHYTGWPDHGTPGDLLPVLSFIRKSSTLNPPDGGPIVVHCSAGVGRTGTYIVIDAMIKQAADKNELNVYGFLKHIRGQRNHLVQTEEQYIFLHDALVEYLTSGVTEIKVEKVCEYVADLTSSLSGFQSGTLLEKQYANVVAFSPKEYDIVAARKSYNDAKNRAHDLVPLEASRVGLTPKPCVEGSDYINASWLQGYEKFREFIVTQHPTVETKDEFWSMLWDHNAQTVVLLTSVDASQDLPVFWPGLDADYEQECFKVKFICSKELPEEGHSTLDFVISSCYDDYELKVRMIQCAGWPQRSSNPPHKVLEFVSLVQEWHLEYQNGPLVVVDRYGGTEAATFCALTTLKKQLDNEESIDVYLICKLYHNKRPGVWRSQEDYLYIYRVLESLASKLAGHSLGCESDISPEVINGGGSGSSENIIERRHSSSEWRGSAEKWRHGGSGQNMRITVNRRHSLPFNTSASTGIGGSQDFVLDIPSVPAQVTSSSSTANSKTESPNSGEGRGASPLSGGGGGDVFSLSGEPGGGMDEEEVGDIEGVRGEDLESAQSSEQDSNQTNSSTAVLLVDETSFSK